MRKEDGCPHCLNDGGADYCSVGGKEVMRMMATDVLAMKIIMITGGSDHEDDDIEDDDGVDNGDDDDDDSGGYITLNDEDYLYFFFPDDDHVDYGNHCHNTAITTRI